MAQNKTKKQAIEKAAPRAAEIEREARVYVPATDVYEKEDVILVRCDLPGVRQEKVDVRLDDDELEIVAAQASSAPEGCDLLVGEYETGIFRRKFGIPQEIDRDKIRARLHNGVLDVELPKAEKARPRKIEIAVS